MSTVRKLGGSVRQGRGQLARGVHAVENGKTVVVDLIGLWHSTGRELSES